MGRYLSIFTITTFAIIFAVSLVNFIVDPYRLFSAFEWNRINRIKPYAYNEEAFAKALLAEKIAAKALILGNSRAEVGLDPTHPGWPVHPVLNLAVPGTEIEAALAYLRHASASTLPSLVVLGVDFGDFLAKTQKSGATEMPGAVKPAESAEDGYDLSVYPDGRPNNAYEWRVIKNRFIKTVSLDAFWHSIGTLYYQGNPYSRDLTRQGFNPMRDYYDIVKKEGYNATFKQKDFENSKRYAKSLKETVELQDKWRNSFQIFRAIKKFCDSHGVRLIVVIYPYHAHLLEIFNEAELWPAFEGWKRGLVTAMEEVSGQSNDYELWDFSGYNSYTTEVVPKAREKAKTVQWYWEAGHFKKELGDVMLERIFASSNENQTAAPGFGVRLTSANLDDKLAEDRQARTRYVTEYANDIADLADMVARH